MAGQTWRGYPVGKLKVKGFMGIGMALQTNLAVSQLIVRFTFVAHGAFGNYFRAPRTVLKVAVKTRNSGFMLTALTVYGCGLFLMALDTIRNLEFPARLGRGNKKRCGDQKKYCRPHDTKQ